MSALTPGVYRRDADGALSVVHAYEDDDYALDDVFELLAIGTRHGPGRLVLTRHELRVLAVTAHAQSFDHAQAFIRMCLDIAAQQIAPGAAEIALVSVG